MAEESDIPKSLGHFSYSQKSGKLTASHGRTLIKKANHMKEKNHMKINKTVIHYMLRVAILLGTGYYVLYLWKTDQLHYYIAPKMSVYVYGAGIAVMLLAVHQFYLLVGEWLKANEERGQSIDGAGDHRSELVASGLACECASCVPDGVATSDATSDSGGDAFGVADDRASTATMNVRDQHHDHIPRHFHWKQAVAYSLLFFPLLLAVVLPEKALSGEIAAKKGMNLSSGAQIQEKRADALADLGSGLHSPDGSGDGTNTDWNPYLTDPEFANPANRPNVTGVKQPDGTTIYGGTKGVPPFLSTGEYDADFAMFASIIYKRDVIRVEEKRFMEYLTTFDLFLNEFVGKKVELSGFVFREEKMGPEQFIVGRLALQCCSADATPYGIMARSDKDQTARLTDNSWVRVTGEIGKVNYAGAQILELQVLDVTPIDEPSRQYVYPNYNFLNGVKAE